VFVWSQIQNTTLKTLTTEKDAKNKNEKSLKWNTQKNSEISSLARPNGQNIKRWKQHIFKTKDTNKQDPKNNYLNQHAKNFKIGKNEK